MHPAYSVILFTTISGLGYGLLMLMGLSAALGILTPRFDFGAVTFGLAFACVTFGLLSSLFHLGHPERAWRALTQWRSSWLSREGVLAIITYGPAVAFAALWLAAPRDSALLVAAGLATAALSIATVSATGMIYASLKPIPRWHNGWVVPVYVAFAFASGAVVLTPLTRLFGQEHVIVDGLAIVAVVLVAGLKLGYWRAMARAGAHSTAESATGLGAFGTVRLLDPPHTGSNYLMREMGYGVARKHALKLRRFVLWGGFALPASCVAAAAGLTSFVGAGLTAMVLSLALTMIAAVAMLLGAVVERWLFFAEAQHSVTLYYGAAQV